MRTRKTLRNLFLLSCLLVLGVSDAGITSPSQHFIIAPADTLDFEIALDCSTSIAAFVTELRFDAAVFETPQIFPRDGAAGCFVRSHEIEPGKFRILFCSSAFSQPGQLAPISTDAPIAAIRLRPRSGISLPSAQTLRFEPSLSAASTPGGVSLTVAPPNGLGQTIVLGDIEVSIVTAAANWPAYH